MEETKEKSLNHISRIISTESLYTHVFAKYKLIFPLSLKLIEMRISCMYWELRTLRLALTFFNTCFTIKEPYNSVQLK